MKCTKVYQMGVVYDSGVDHCTMNRNIYVLLHDSFFLAENEDSQQKQLKLLDDLITLCGINAHHYLHPYVKVLKAGTLHLACDMLRADIIITILLFIATCRIIDHVRILLCAPLFVQTSCIR